MKTLKTLLILVFFGITLVTASSCRETARGVGRDVEDAGDAVRDATN